MRLTVLTWSLLLLGVFSANTSAQTRRLHDVSLKVIDGGGAFIPSAYVAVYRETEPWDNPRSELLTSAAGVAPLQLEDGTNVVLIAAEGFPPKMVMLPGEKGGAERTIHLDAGMPIRGSVSDASGNAIEGAHVSVLQPDYAPRAKKYLGRRETVTDPSGEWRLDVARQGNAFLIEAAGYAAAFANDTSLGPNGLDVVLTPAVPLRISFDRIDPDLIVTLRREGETRLSEAVQDKAWSRPVATKTIEWQTFPAGTVHVSVRHRDPTRFVHDERLRTLVLEQGKPRTLNVSLPPVPQRASAFVTVFAKTTEAEQPAPYRGIEPLDVAVVRAIAGVVLYLNTPDAHGVVIPTRTHILLPRIPTEKGADSLLRVTALPRADATLNVRTTEPAVPLPVQGNAEHQQCGGHVRTVLPFPIRRDGGVSLVAPGDCRRTVLRWPPFEPVVIDRGFPAGKQTPLGMFELRAAAALEIHVKREGSEALVQGAGVRVLFNVSDETALAEVTTDATGRAVAEGLPIGRRLYVEARDPKTALTGSTSVDLQPGERRVVNPLYVQEPAKVILRARIAPAFLEQHPGAWIRTVALHSIGADAPPARIAKLLENTDMAIFDELRPGQWKVVAVIHGVIEQAGQSVDVAELTIAAGEEKTIEPDIAPPFFRGRVTHQGRTVKATIGVSENPTIGVTRWFPSRDDGTFIALLPKPGIFAVEVRLASAPATPMKVGQVSFEDPARPVEIALAYGQMTVRVRAEAAPVEGARLTLTSRNAGIAGLDTVVMAKVTDANGEAVFDMLRPGTWLLDARSEDDASHAQKNVTTTADGASVVELELKRGDLVAGVVRDPAGRRVSDARIACFFIGPQRLPEATSTRTRGDGSFELRVNPVQGFASCSAITPTRAVAAFRVRAAERQADVVLPQQSGSLTIDRWWAGYNDWWWLVSDDGSAVSLREVAVGTNQAGGALSIGSLRAGSWKVVRISTPDALGSVASGNAQMLPAVESFRITSGNSIAIDLGIGETTRGGKP